MLKNIVKNRNNLHIFQRLDIVRKVSVPSHTENPSIDDKVKILTVINNSTENDLIKIGISKSRSELMITWRNKNGNFEDLNQLLKINGFGKKVLENIKNKILNPNKTKNKNVEKTKNTGRYSIPVISESLRSQIKSCLSLHIGVSSVSWCRFQLNSKAPCLLTDCKHSNLIDKKLHIYDLIKQCLLIIDDIPDADCYVLESPKIAQMGQPGNPVQININVQKSQLIAVISYALIKRSKIYIENENTESTNTASNLFYLKQYLYARLFDTLVGGEIVSSSKAVLDLMKTDYNEDTANVMDNFDINDISNIRSKVQIPVKLKEEFRNFSGVEREFLGQSILIGLTFIRLCLLKCPHSIEKISNNIKEKQN